tara:strand:- start:15 stop:632 length:618 start_codon:yes stop_codon:yes gene_type:complete
MVLWAPKQKGFTIVELLIVIVVIAILAAITVVAYTGIQERTKNVAIQSDLRQVAQLIEAYAAENGSYPSTGSLSNIYTDAECNLATDSGGYKGEDWVPGINNLPQNPGLEGAGNGSRGCYTYSSDGTNYILSAWNAKWGGPNTDTMYRRLGWRETGNFASNQYYCNHTNIGGNASGTYNIGADYYKHSYTISSITTCNETPPAGA